MITGASGIVAAGLLSSTTPVSAAMPRAEWANTKQLLIVCRGVADTPAATRRLCDSLGRNVAERAGRRAPMPVAVAEFGDPRMFRFDSVVLLVNARAEADRDGRLVSFALRPWRAVAGDDNDLFGSPPRIARVSATDNGPVLDAAIDAALGAVLPWQKTDS